VSLRVYAYQGCDTCRKALKFLAERNVVHETVPIRKRAPTVPELRRMLDLVGGDLRRLFNTSGGDYKAMNMKAKLPTLSVEEALELLSRHGNLVKRPFALSAKGGAVGFRPDEWETLVA
jgi:arsenate reductase